ncbi:MULTISPECIES: fimbrial protein [unclassified Pseudomonas]|uniref:fimbrial protein n=1 Tax=unclassified Pseudomonas TaxID=196821 RepID=UPI001B31B570|nr:MULTISPECIES: fimbrial protein [unclassified Pseudomonas]MBP5946880.1 type 1 fimbrial protein [Pseudomonas sp. P9(2020)]MBZ9565018.1 type 1 fimbrial protein [Pseudomonas sp. P116]
MKNFSIALLAAAILGASCNALAEDPVKPTQGGSGQISFTGVINNDACSVDGSDANRVIAVNMGDVSIKDMGTAANPAGGRVAGNHFNLNVNCNKGTKVAMIFDPSSGGSGFVPDDKKLLALTPGNGTATNVGIALLDSNGVQINLSNRNDARIEAGMHGAGEFGGDSTLSFSAAYVTTGVEGSATAGRGDATLPFILEYN